MVKGVQVVVIGVQVPAMAAVQMAAPVVEVHVPAHATVVAAAAAPVAMAAQAAQAAPMPALVGVETFAEVVVLAAVVISVRIKLHNKKMLTSLFMKVRYGYAGKRERNS